MLLVHERKDRPGTWEVAWTWMPFFLAADTKLVRDLDEHLGKKFRLQDTTRGVQHEMHKAVVDFIEERYPIKGLAVFLEGIRVVEP